MTEAEFNSCDDPQKMLQWLLRSGRLTGRKARLFAVGCCRRVEHQLIDQRSRKAVTVAERFADGLASEDELKEAYAEAWAALRGKAVTVGARVDAARAAGRAVQPNAAEAATYAAHEASWVIPDALEEELGNIQPQTVVEETMDQVQKEEQACQCDLLRCIFGPLPFRFIAIEASWRTLSILALARHVYDERDTAALPVLADALEEVGCVDSDILGHLRGAGPHARRGCWPVDLLLKKE